tara:strand:- start:1181 stop:1426 length:246 start_codon:yes stop_codon:yes gene_type:complete
VAPSGELKAFETAERVRPAPNPTSSTNSARATATAITATLLPLRSRQLLEVDFFSRCAAKKLLPQAARRWNLASLHACRRT